MIDRSSLPGHWLPGACWNLRRNPFGELTRQERVELAVVDIGSIAELVGGIGEAVQLIGQCGRGKTTRMLALSSWFSDSSYVYLPEDGPCPPVAEGNPILIDEAQRLPRAASRRIFTSGAPLVLATHHDMGRRLRRFGYRVHTELIGHSNTPELICNVLNRRIEASRLAEGPLPTISLIQARRLWQRFGSDIRGIEHHLYERFQNQVNQHGEMRFVD